MDPWFGEVNRAAETLLGRAGYEVVSPSAQTCCGALAAHDGAMPEATVLAAEISRRLAGFDLVVATAAGCSAHLREYDHFGGGAEVAGECPRRNRGGCRADRSGPPATARSRFGDRWPCRIPATSDMHKGSWPPPGPFSPRPDTATVEIDPDGICCGAAGIYSLLRPEASAELGRRKADQVRASGATWWHRPTPDVNSKSGHSWGGPTGSPIRSSSIWKHSATPAGDFPSFSLASMRVID